MSTRGPDRPSSAKPHWSAELKRARKTCKNPAGNCRLGAQIDPQNRTKWPEIVDSGPKSTPKTGRNQATNARDGAHKAARTDSDRCRTVFGVLRPRSNTFKLRDSSADTTPTKNRYAQKHNRDKTKTTQASTNYVNYKCHLPPLLVKVDGLASTEYALGARIIYL